VSDDLTGTADKNTKEPPRSRCQFSMRVLLLFPVAIALPFAAAHLLDSAAWGVLVLFIELVAGILYPPTRVPAVWVFALLLLLWLLSPAISVARAPARTAQCTNNMKQIMLALLNYHDTYQCFPPAYVADDDGRPMHSWRVLILPFLEQQPLYDQYRFDEPWDGPNNSQLAGKIGHWPFRCPSVPSPRPAVTNYVLVTGDGTAWADGRAPKLDEFTDGPANTIILVEIADSDIQWLEPRDITLEQAMRGINSGPHICISSWHPARGNSDRQDSANVAFADGSVGNLKNDFPLAELRKLLTYQGGERVKRLEHN
jgi:prepilin-type processing-associated H-X9-DG protein